MDIAEIDTDSGLKQLQHLATPIWVFDVSNHAIWWANRSALEFWGAASLADLLKRDFSSDSESVRLRLRQIADDDTGTARVRDTWTLYPNGVPRTVLMTFKQFRISPDNMGLLVEVNRVVDVEGNDDALRILEAVKTSSVMISTFTGDGTLLAQNPAALACYGNGEVGGRLQSRVPSVSMSQQILDTVHTNRSFDAETTVQARAGPRMHRIFARRGRDPIDGHFVVVVNEEDVTEQSQWQNKLQELNDRLEEEVNARTKSLRQSEERYELATRTASIWDWHPLDDTFFVSPRFIEALGYKPCAFYQKLHAEKALSFVHPEDAAQFEVEVRKHLAAPEQSLEFNVRFMTATGEARWYQVRGVGISNSEGRVVRSVGLLTDIHEHKMLEASLVAAHRLEAVGQLTGGIAHDFNNLLTVIGGNAELLETQERVDHDLTRAIVEATGRGAKLTRHLLAFARKQNLQPRTVNLSDLINDMGSTILRQFNDAVDLRFDVPSGTWPVFADPTQIEGAILNLALNARDAMPGGGVLTVSCENVRCRDAEPDAALGTGDYVKINVHDTGFGMDPQMLSQAFEPFFSTKGVGAGSGLGLSMVLGFSRQSGGDTRIESAPEQGTIVSVFLPRAEQTPAATIRNADPDHVEKGQKELVFLLEDDPEVQHTLRNMLESLNYRVLVASDAQTAFKRLKDAPPPMLYLVDVMLAGGETGVTFAQTVQTQDPDARIVFVSGHSRDELNDIQTRINCAGFLQKPFSVADLSELLTRALGPA